MALLANGDSRARAALRAAHLAGDELVLPAVVLAEVSRGDGRRDAKVNRVVNAIRVLQPANEHVARLAGRLLGMTGRVATLDSLVVASGVVAGATAVLHHDADDLPPLCDAAGLRSWLMR